jgi:hypothetical protein
MTSKHFCQSWVWWYMPVIPTLRMLRQLGLKFEANPGYIGRPCKEGTLPGSKLPVLVKSPGKVGIISPLIAVVGSE